MKMKRGLVLLALLFAIGIVVASARSIETADASELTLPSLVLYASDSCVLHTILTFHIMSFILFCICTVHELNREEDEIK